MIYFDNEKQAYSFEIENHIATIDDETWKKHAGKENWDIINGVFTDISNTPEYILKQKEKENTTKKQELTNQINELDIKRIRAIAEPSQKTQTQTWLDFYTEQIQNIRNQIGEL